MTPRPYQVDVDDRTEAAFLAGKRRVLDVLPTGAGKTVLFANSAQRCVRRYGMPTLVVAHRRELIRQASEKLEAIGLPVTRIEGRKPNMSTANVCHVGSIQTLAGRLDQLPRYGRIIPDEAHHSVAGQWLRLFESQPQAQVQGVTATPERLDGRGLGDVFDHMVVGPSIGDLIAEGYLSPVRVFGPPSGAPDLSTARTVAGDWTATDLADAMDKPKLTGDAADEYLWHCGGQPAIAFCASVAHAEHTAAQFAALGWRAAAVHGNLPGDVRDARIAGLADGSVEVLTTCDLISEGLDVPAVACVILLRPTKSLGLYLQQIGRGLRVAPGKPWLVVLDHAGNVFRHGWPDDPRVWSLEGRPKKEAPPAVRQCGQCFAMYRPAPVCPACGHVAVADTRAGRVVSAAATGELVELQRLRSTPLRALLKETRGYAALLNLARARGLPDEQAQKWLEWKNNARARFMSGAA